MLREIAEYRKAIKDLEAVRRLGENDSEVQRELGVCYFLMGERERAYELWEKLPDPVRAAETFAEYDLVEQAQRLYREAIRQSPHEASSYKKLGGLLNMIGSGERQRSRNEPDKACHSRRRMQTDSGRSARCIDQRLDCVSLHPIASGRFAGVDRRNQRKSYEACDEPVQFSVSQVWHQARRSCAALQNIR